MLLEAFSSLLHQCSKTKAFWHGLSIHSTLVKNGMLSDLLISNHIINMYAKCGKINCAKKMFDEMSERNLVSWSALISGYDQAGQPAMAIDLFSNMWLQPNEYVLASTISACATVKVVNQGQQIHALSVKLGYSSVSFVSNSLISMYMKCGECNDAFLVFTGASFPNSVSYNAVINGLVENQQGDKGYEVFKQMCEQGLLPDHFTFVGLLGICTTVKDLWRGMELHCQTIKYKLDRTSFVGNIIVTMYSKFNIIEEAKKAFKMIEEKDIISWNALIAACCNCLDHAMALSAFKRMANDVSFQPDDFTYASVLAACAGLSSMCQGKQIHARLLRKELHEDVGVGNALMNMYAKCGCVEYAYTVFLRMGYRNLVTWNSIIAGLGNHGLGKKAVELFEQMKSIGMEPDSVTFLGLLAACNHAGLVDEGKSYFNSMYKIYGIAPDIEHFSCLIDLLARAGRVKEAEDYVETLLFRNDPVVLGSLLSACRLHEDVLIGERLGGRLLKLQPAFASSFVLLSNLYALGGMWDSVARARKMLKGSGLKKEPGFSLIEVMGVAEKFGTDDFSHSRVHEILHILKTLCWEREEILRWSNLQEDHIFI